ncbi:hypothetical protein JQU17_17175 [Ponticoccus sp. SC2-23]|uniref:hypothetical protein n=1 Tax=Alexandriicola marinus TaxID=2081710 RepID=UPI000FD98853|nr:hypothetical protein [Alexandriicola marinus]MBM1222172.1 hypothetical protein [Ponticoccus sp. SC6-9]MBM1226859.1 hypothetical protein [Ponticoccus sp. SC6-15]MBM1231119.1 hypothetical protein [Ponticoccus sp. SC6-38]MBM1235629.1 hypothetical protein [Ponticoccus sp. SC6-45]MBM1240141.1 hypothetical protein [Ponticoccus sp. SC6-49]MBM1244495.1 hypothetical protein [Ponticoccus sp. SC2-64]MBM1249103.1 hypothetical protein [Ponticoccus sp. SC6-42]MBM1253796.1 hypothetical protein [Pontico
MGDLRLSWSSAGAALALCAAIGLPAAPATAQEAHAEGDPWCDLIDPGEAGGVDCALEAAAINLFFDYDLTDGIGELVLTQSTPEGGERRVSDPIEIDGVWALAPGLRDINLDGSEDLFIPISESMVNNTFMVWQLDADGFYEPSGFIGGFSIDGFENRGELIVSTERLNAATYVESARLLDQDGFIHLYDMMVDYAARECTIVDPNGIMAAGLNEQALIAECMDREWE